MKTIKQNLQHIDEIRFLTIHVILLNHWQLSILLAKGNVDTSLVNFWIDLTSPALALISGYLFFYGTKERFNFFKKLKSRIHSLVIPYLFWTLSFFFIFFFLKEMYIKVFHSEGNWYLPPMAPTFSNIIATIVNPPLVNFWYLQNLILIIPFNYFFYLMLRNGYAFAALFLAVILIYAFNITDIYFQARFLPYYLIGCFLGYHEKYVPKIRLNVMATLLLIPVLFYISVVTGAWEYSNIWVIVVKIAIALFFLVSVYNMIDSNSNSWVVTYLKKNKAYSFFLFAINIFLFTLVQRAMMKVGFENYLGNKYFTLLFAIVSYGIVLALALLLAKLLKSKFSSFYYFITGR